MLVNKEFKKELNNLLLLVAILVVGFVFVQMANFLLVAIEKTSYEVVSIFFLMIFTSNFLVKLLLLIVDNN